ncbi:MULTISPECIES: relaxase [unclassified Mesorhizobium]|uniref:relaxase/mobilization nuclease domain-containing protein n=1 Tax=unclassified Mesorhizobium TaxID=325217 RepID=UPI002417FAC5|nr:MULTISPECIES: relaxase [unclassified Mesorhizobium]MDG4901421.1 relaxase [Mesorhizobium sp. WSM4962]MDG4918909.1 relaxase [Mesorhizobium sp. WSM4989]
MILKGSQRANGADLAIHLMNSYDNESIEVAEVYGTVAGDLYGAFAEFEAVSRGTKAKEYLYSLSISPPSPLTREQYFEAISTIEHRLGLQGQPRAVVFHVKQDGYGRAREHCHVVWSRIDIENMRAIHMSHDRSRLMDLACELGRKFGLELAPGLLAWEAKQQFEKEKLEATLAEKAQAEETGISPEQRRAKITAAYEASDTPEAFRAALEQKGYVLAKGDKRGLVVVDKFGNPHSLTRYLKGFKASEVKKKLASLRPEELPSVDQAREIMRQRTQAYDDTQREQQAEQRDQRAEERLEKERAHAEKLAARRLEIQQAKQEMLTRQQAERLALHAAQKAEADGLLFRVRRAVADLIGRTPGLRSVLSHIQRMTSLDPAERHRLENDALARRHEREKLEFERRERFQARIEKRETLSRERALRREKQLAQDTRLERERTAEQAHTVENKAKQDFHDAARDDGLWKRREFEDGELSDSFNDAASLKNADSFSDDDGESYAPDWADDADDDGDDDGPKFKRERGHSYKRDDDP